MPLRLGFCFCFKLDNGSMSVTCKRGKQGSRGTGEDDVGRSLRKTWARCLVSLFIARPLPSCRAGLPQAEADGRSGGASSAPDSSPSALPTCHFLTSSPQPCAPLLSTRFTPGKGLPASIHAQVLGTEGVVRGTSTVTPGGGIWSEDLWEQKRLAFTHLVSPD